jgi:Uma2 family endonuclease
MEGNDVPVRVVGARASELARVKPGACGCETAGGDEPSHGLRLPQPSWPGGRSRVGSREPGPRANRLEGVAPDERRRLAWYASGVTTAPTGPRVSFEAFLAAEEHSDTKHEWLDGVVYDMSRGTPEHGRLSAAIARELGVALKGECVVYSSDTMIYVTETKFATYADSIVVCGSLATYRVAKLGEAVTNPTLIVEVLSDSTEKYDRGEKFAHYMRLSSLEQYVLVAQHERRIEVFRRPEHGHWAHTVADAGGSVELHGRTIQVDAVYA